MDTETRNVISRPYNLVIDYISSNGGLPETLQRLGYLLGVALKQINYYYFIPLFTLLKYLSTLMYKNLLNRPVVLEEETTSLDLVQQDTVVEEDVLEYKELEIFEAGTTFIFDGLQFQITSVDIANQQYHCICLEIPDVELGFECGGRDGFIIDFCLVDEDNVVDEPILDEEQRRDNLSSNAQRRPLNRNLVVDFHNWLPQDLQESLESILSINDDFNFEILRNAYFTTTKGLTNNGIIIDERLFRKACTLYTGLKHIFFDFLYIMGDPGLYDFQSEDFETPNRLIRLKAFDTFFLSEDGYCDHTLKLIDEDKIGSFLEEDEYDEIVFSEDEDYLL